MNRLQEILSKKKIEKKEKIKIFLPQQLVQVLVLLVAMGMLPIYFVTLKYRWRGLHFHFYVVDCR